MFESMVGAYRGFEFRRGLDRGPGMDMDGWIRAGGARVGLLDDSKGGELDLRRVVTVS